jgi:hypothetical protein
VNENGLPKNITKSAASPVISETIQDESKAEEVHQLEEKKDEEKSPSNESGEFLIPNASKTCIIV